MKKSTGAKNGKLPDIPWDCEIYLRPRDGKAMIATISGVSQRHAIQEAIAWLRKVGKMRKREAATA